MSLSNDLSRVLDWLYSGNALQHSPVALRARMVLLDTVGCIVAGLAKPEPRALATTLAEAGGGPVLLPGCPVPLPVTAAAYTAAVAACWDEACEGLARAHGRPGLHALPPVLALGLAGDASLGRVLDALVVGYEVGGRLGEVLRIRPEMHVDGSWGTLGAVAAVARMQGLDARAAEGAIQGAACHLPASLYHPIARGATVRNAYLGHAAAQGLLQVASVQAGLTAPGDALEALERLVFSGTAGGRSLAPPGEWLIEQGYLKPYAAVRHVHYGAEAAVRWHRRHEGALPPLRALHLRIYREALTYCGNRAPRTAIQAQFSLSYGVAWALLHGDLAPDAYTEAALSHPEVRRLEALVVLEQDEAPSRSEARGARLTVQTAGEEETIAVEAVPGDPSLPFTPVATREKFLRYAAPHLGLPRAEAMAGAVLEGDLERPLSDVLGG